MMITKQIKNELKFIASKSDVLYSDTITSSKETLENGDEKISKTRVNIKQGKGKITNITDYISSKDKPNMRYMYNTVISESHIGTRVFELIGEETVGNDNIVTNAHYKEISSYEDNITETNREIDLTTVYECDDYIVVKKSSTYDEWKEYLYMKTNNLLPYCMYDTYNMCIDKSDNFCFIALSHEFNDLKELIILSDGMNFYTKSIDNHGTLHYNVSPLEEDLSLLLDEEYNIENIFKYVYEKLLSKNEIEDKDIKVYTISDYTLYPDSNELVHTVNESNYTKTYTYHISDEYVNKFMELYKQTDFKL